ncbi:MAG: hypothetical protein WDW38_011101 [Sanguina aurantia]
MRSRRDELFAQWSAEEVALAVPEQRQALAQLQLDCAAAVGSTSQALADTALLMQDVAAREGEDGQHVEAMQAKIGEARAAKATLALKEAEQRMRHSAAAAEAGQAAAQLLQLDLQLQETSSAIYLLTGETPLQKK